jgi:FPC/CPF motif-containing protein YcgG
MDRAELAPATGADPLGNYCRYDGTSLTRPFDAGPPSVLSAYVHDAFRNLILNPQFPCVGARAAVRQNAYAFSLYDRMGVRLAAQGLARDLDRFIGDPGLRDKPLTTFAASFVEPVAASESAFETLLWTTLQHVTECDSAPWAVECSPEPDAQNFAFSFGGTGFFVVGLHAASSRFARRFAWPTLVFNRHAQFEELKKHGKYATFQHVIRDRDVSLQGSANPMLADFGDRSEARQYAGRSVDETWRCPFHARQNGTPRSDT